MADREATQVEQGKQLLEPPIAEMLEAIGEHAGLRMTFAGWIPRTDTIDYWLLVRVNGKQREITVPREWLADYPGDEESRPTIEAEIQGMLEDLAEEFDG